MKAHGTRPGELALRHRAATVPLTSFVDASCQCVPSACPFGLSPVFSVAVFSLAVVAVTVDPGLGGRSPSDGGPTVTPAGTVPDGPGGPAGWARQVTINTKDAITCVPLESTQAGPPGAVSDGRASFRVFRRGHSASLSLSAVTAAPVVTGTGPLPVALPVSAALTRVGPGPPPSLWRESHD